MTSPYVLLDYQRRWIEDESPVKLCVKARRVGITWAQCADSVLLAAQQGGMDTWYTGYAQSISLEFVKDCAEWSRHFSLVTSDIDEAFFPTDNPDKHIHGFKISYASGGRVVGLSSKPEGLRGKKGLVVCDEAAYAPDVEALLTSAIALTMWGGRVALISTQASDLNPFNQLVMDTRSGKLPYSLHEIDLDTALQQGLFRRICLMTGQDYSAKAEAAWRAELFASYPSEEKANAELLCIPSSGTGAYISRASIERCLIERPLIRLALTDDFLSQREADRQIQIDHWIADQLRPHLETLPQNLKHYAGLDFARSGDLSALVVLSELENLTYETPFCLEMRNVPFESQRQILFAVLDQLPHFIKIAMDSSGNGSYLAEVTGQRFRMRVEAVNFTERWYTLHMPTLKDWIENRRVLMVKHVDVVRDLRQIELIRGIPRIDPNKRAKGSDGLNRHGDVAIALLLAVYAANEGGAPASGSIVTRQSPHYQSLHHGRFGLLR